MSRKHTMGMRTLAYALALALAAGCPYAASSACAASAEADEADGEAADELTDEEQELSEEASTSLSSAQEVVDGFSEQADSLSAIAVQLAEAQEALEALQQQRDELVADATTTQAGEQAQADKEQAQAALASLAATSVLELVFGTTTLSELAERTVELQDEIADDEQAIEENAAAIEADEQELADCDEQIAAAEQMLAETLDAGNDAAAGLEQADAQSRAYDDAAVESVEGIDETKSDAQELADSAADAIESHDASRETAREALCSWYGSVDELSGVESELTFGTGDDFALSQEEFVAKWGAAIDAFLADYGQQMGFDVPLCGYGETMAACAYEYEIDPRLCAAVAIAESSGGRYCIRSCNAWGWGARDASPYASAASWSSFEEAIEGWHEALAASTTGLATAGSISALGELYCSSASWTATVCEQMQAISAYAESLQEADEADGS